MPLYEYECDSCGHRFEIIQKFSDPPASTCPKCSGSVHKMISAPAFQLKGTGWYITDYAKKDSGGASSGASKETKSDQNEKSDKAGEKAERTEKAEKAGNTEKAGKADASEKSSGSSEKSSTPAPSTPAKSESKP